MGFLDNILGRIGRNISDVASREISDGINKGAKKLVKKEGKKLTKCPQCSQKITQSGLKFCDNCGYPLLVTCPDCKVTRPVGTKVCSQCGKPFQQPLSPKEWKKKHK
jgi:predicted amidophosphoribosyltransferase